MCQNHHIIKEARIFSTEKSSSKEIYLILISNLFNKLTSNIDLENLFKNTTLDWSKICLLPRLAATDTTFLTTYSFSLKDYTLLEKHALFFPHFVRLWKKLSYIYFMPEFMLNLFKKNYRRNFWMMLSCHDLQHRLLFLDWLMKQTAFITFWILFYWFLNIMFTGQERSTY